MYKKGFLTNISVEEGIFPNERIVKSKNYEGKIISGFFNASIIKDQKLKVMILYQERDKIMIIPQGGQFLEEGQDKRIIVNKKDLVYFS